MLPFAPVSRPLSPSEEEDDNDDVSPSLRTPLAPRSAKDNVPSDVRRPASRSSKDSVEKKKKMNKKKKKKKATASKATSRGGDVSGPLLFWPWKSGDSDDEELPRRRSSVCPPPASPRSPLSPPLTDSSSSSSSSSSSPSVSATRTSPPSPKIKILSPLSIVDTVQEVPTNSPPPTRSLDEISAEAVFYLFDATMPTNCLRSERRAVFHHLVTLLTADLELQVTELAPTPPPVYDPSSDELLSLSVRLPPDFHCCPSPPLPDHLHDVCHQTVDFLYDATCDCSDADRRHVFRDLLTAIQDEAKPLHELMSAIVWRTKEVQLPDVATLEEWQLQHKQMLRHFIAQHQEIHHETNVIKGIIASIVDKRERPDLEDILNHLEELKARYEDTGRCIHIMFKAFGPEITKLAHEEERQKV